MENYNDYISSCLKSASHLEFIGKTVLGYDIPMLSKGEKREGGVLLVGAVHAREHITIPLLLKLFSDYSGNHPFDCVPALNIDGVLLAKNGLSNLPLKSKDKKKLLDINGGSPDFSLWKANIRAVDINVNFDAGWGEGEQNGFCPAPSSYVGEYAGSEPETQSILNLINRKNYAIVVAYHSKGEEVYFGFREDNRYREEAERFASYLNYALKETLNSAGGIKDYWTYSTGRLGLTVEVGKDSLSHPYPPSELPNLISQHKGSLELLEEIAKELWKKDEYRSQKNTIFS